MKLRVNYGAASPDLVRAMYATKQPLDSCRGDQILHSLIKLRVS